MRKLFSLIAVLCFIFALFTMPALAGRGGEGNNTHCNGVGNDNSPCGGGDGGGGISIGIVTSTVNPFAGGWSGDYSYDDSGFWFFKGDDWGEAGGGSGGDISGFGEGRLFGFGKTWANGDLDAFGCTDSYAFALDIPFFNYSEAWAGAHTEATVQGEIDAGFFGLAIGDAKAELEGTVEGSVYQNTYAVEGNLNHGTAAVAGGGSTASFYGKAYDSDYDGGFIYDKASADVNMTGTADVSGHSVVNIDKYGNNQSAYAMTENQATANVYGDNFEINSIEGVGSVGAHAVVENGGSGAYAGGNGSFTYSGTGFGGVSGGGMTVINANANVGGGCGDNCFSSSVSVHSEAQNN